MGKVKGDFSDFFFDFFLYVFFSKKKKKLYMEEKLGMEQPGGSGKLGGKLGGR